MAKRRPSNSITAAVTAMRDAQAGPLEPPSYLKLRETDQPYWAAIVRARARSTWNESDLATAANLARARADIERVQSEIDAEGDIVVNARGTPVMNPRHTLLEILSRRSVALARMLYVHAGATLGESRDNAKAAAVQREAERAIEDQDEELIPRLRAV